MSPRSIRCASSVARARFVALVVGDQLRRRADPELVEQPAGAAGVLAGDVVGADQRLADPRGDVVEVADRRRADDRARPASAAPLAELDRAPSPRRRSSRRRCRASPRGSASRSSACSARSRTSRAGRVQQQVAGGDHAAADDDRVRLEDVGEARAGDAEPAADQVEDADRGLVAGRAPPRSPPCRRSARPRRASCRAPSRARFRPPPGPRARARSPRRAPRRSRGWGSCPGRAGRRPGSRCGRARRRRRSSRGRPRRRGSGRRRSRCRPSASPCRGVPCGGAVEVLGQGGDVGVVVDEDRQADPLGDEVADRQVGERQVDGGDGDAAARGRSSPGSRARPRSTLGARVARLVDLADQQLDQLVLGLAGRGLALLVEDVGAGRATPISIFVPPRSTPIVSPPLTRGRRLGGG